MAANATPGFEVPLELVRRNIRYRVSTWRHATRVEGNLRVQRFHRFMTNRENVNTNSGINPGRPRPLDGYNPGTGLEMILDIEFSDMLRYLWSIMDPAEYASNHKRSPFVDQLCINYRQIAQATHKKGGLYKNLLGPESSVIKLMKIMYPLGYNVGFNIDEKYRTRRIRRTLKVIFGELECDSQKAALFRREVLRMNDLYVELLNLEVALWRHLTKLELNPNTPNHPVLQGGRMSIDDLKYFRDAIRKFKTPMMWGTHSDLKLLRQ